MSKFDRRNVRRTIAATAATLLIASLPLASAQAAPKTVDPTGNWKLTGLQIGNAPIVPCPTPTTAFSERWYCTADTMLNLKKNGKYTDNIPIITTNKGANKGTWFSNAKDVIVFDDAGNKGLDARAYGMSVKGKTMKVSLQSAGRGPAEAVLELHMIFTKQK
jgi:hypothetical protein